MRARNRCGQSAVREAVGPGVGLAGINTRRAPRSANHLSNDKGTNMRANNRQPRKFVTLGDYRRLDLWLGVAQIAEHFALCSLLLPK